MSDLERAKQGNLFLEEGDVEVEEDGEENNVDEDEDKENRILLGMDTALSGVACKRTPVSYRVWQTMCKLICMKNKKSAN